MRPQPARPRGVILIEKAGSKYSPTAALDNTLLDQMNEIDDQIETWQNKMSDKVDYYTNKFTQLEMLDPADEFQSSTLSGLMGGYLKSGSAEKGQGRWMDTRGYQYYREGRAQLPDTGRAADQVGMTALSRN